MTAAIRIATPTLRAQPRRVFAGILWLAVLACASGAGAQSHKSSRASTRAAVKHRVPGAARTAPAERDDVARFRKRVETALAAPGPDKGFWGLLVTDAATGEVVYARNADNYFSPASDAKLFTTALALASLGPDFRLRTVLGTTGSVSGAGPNQMLAGDLILKGAGDANLSNRKFPYDKKVERVGAPDKVLDEMADAVASSGIKTISGDVVVDDSLFARERFPSGWTTDDILWSYGAAVSAIAINDNTFTLDVRPGDRDGALAAYSVEPATDFYTVENIARTGVPGSAEKLSVSREPGSHAILLGGTIPARGPPRKLTIAVEEPAEYAAHLLVSLLEARGVHVNGTARAHHTFHANDWLISSPHDDAPLTVLAEHLSPTLSDDVRLTNKMSENLHAELLLLLSAHERAGIATRDEAVKFAANFFRTAGIADGDVILHDGSGLSRGDLVTPRAVVQMLTYATRQPWGEVYRSSLPVAGEDGTLSERMKHTAAEGRISAKTGTIDHVNSLSGYATTARGAHLVFSILGDNNSLHAPAADAVLDSIAVAMVEEIGSAPAKKRKK